MRWTALLPLLMAVVLSPTSLPAQIDEDEAPDRPLPNRRALPRTARVRLPSSSPLSMLRVPELQAELKLSDKQKAAVEAKAKEASEQFTKMFDSLRQGGAANREKVLKTFREVTEKSQTAAREILDDAQRKRLSQIEFQIRGTDYLANEEFHKSLDLTKEQIGKLGELREEYAKKGRKLNDDQRAGVINFAKMAEEMKSLAEKRKADQLALLTKEQKSKLDELRGKEFDVSVFPQARRAAAARPVFRPAPRAAFRRPARPPQQFSSRISKPRGMQLLMDRRVQEELDLTNEQKTSVQSFFDKIRDEMRKELTNARNQGGRPDSDKLRKLITKLEADAVAAVNKTMTAEQRKRFNQLEFQSRGGRALSDEQTAIELKLTDEQKKQIAKLTMEENVEIQEIPRTSAQEYYEKRQKLTERFDKARLDVLNEAQRRQFDELRGKLFEFGNPRAARPAAAFRPGPKV